MQMSPPTVHSLGLNNIASLQKCSRAPGEAVTWPVGVVVEPHHVTNPPALRGSKQWTDRLYIAFRVETNVQVMNGASITILLLSVTVGLSFQHCTVYILHAVICGQFLNCLCSIITCDAHLNARRCCQHRHRVLLSAYNWTSTYWPAGRPVLHICSLQLVRHDTLGHTHCM